MSAPTLLHGATVVDGTGAPPFAADVEIADGVITAVGPNLADDGRTVVDLSGLVLAPGFIDPHTHYDAQVTWDRDLAPSCWHGVTTVLLGHCGYSVAPTHARDRQSIVLTLEAVEGMSREALEAGLDWSFETFPEYLEALDARPNRLNIGALVGHTALRLYVMGDDAMDREATPEEIAQMCDVMRESMTGGALGLSTSRASVDVGAHGKPVPSRLASIDELLAIIAAMGESGRGITQILAGTQKIDPLLELTVPMIEAGNRPVTFGAVLSGLWGPRGGGAAAIERCAELGPGMLVPQIACRPIVQQTNFRDPFFLAIFSQGFVEAMERPPAERRAVYEDPAWRERAREQLHRVDRLARGIVAESSAHPELVRGPTLGEIAAARGTSVWDVMVDLSLEDDLALRFEIALCNDDEDEVGDYLRDTRTLLSLSDAGAHQSQICDAVYATDLLGHWVRDRKELPIELAVWHLTGNPARLFGISDRGEIRTGLAADLVAFDPETVGVEPLERVHDLPGGADRLIARSRGIEHVWVNGTPIRTDGTDVEGARPGRVIRSS